MRVMMAADAVAKRPCSRPWGHSTSLTHRTVRWANALRWAADEMANEEIARARKRMPAQCATGASVSKKRCGQGGTDRNGTRPKVVARRATVGEVRRVTTQLVPPRLDAPFNAHDGRISRHRQGLPSPGSAKIASPH